jgi:hypothetical protein
MAMTDTTRPDPARSAVATAPSLPDPAVFRTGHGEDDRLVAQLAFARAVERGGAAPAPGPEAVEALRAQAMADLSEFAFRYLHNRVEEVRREAVATQLSQLGRGPSFLRLVLANLVALGIAGLAASWLASHPETVTRAANAVARLMGQ